MSLSSRIGGRGPKTIWAQIIAMIEWLENPVKFRLTTGGAQKDVGSVVAGAKLCGQSILGCELVAVVRRQILSSILKKT